MFVESALFFSGLHKEIYILRGSFLQSDIATVTFNFESSFLYATTFLFTLQFLKISIPDIKLTDKSRSSFSLVEK